MFLAECCHLAVVLVLIELAVGEQFYHIVRPLELLTDDLAIINEIVLPHDFSWMGK